MKEIKQIHLPGSDNQLRFTLGNIGLKDKSVLIIGSGCEEIAKVFLDEGASAVELIVQDYESLMNSNMLLDEVESIRPKMMDFEFTDFSNNTFDIVYAQASISSERRNRIVKEIKRILKNDGILSVGEVVKLENVVPPFIQDIFDMSDLEPLFIENVEKYYSDRNFEILQRQDYSKSLKEYYSLNLKKLYQSEDELSDKEKSYYKKLINQLSHQSKVYLKQGGDQFIGFYSIIAQVNNR